MIFWAWIGGFSGGFFVGLLVFERPVWATNLIAKIKTKIGLS